LAYNKHYGFRENPFNMTPDSSFFFPSEGHKTALDALYYAIKQRKGFVVITGEIGSGKTTVLRTLLRKLDHNVKTAVITNTHLSPKGVITLILEDLGIPYKDGTKEKLLIQLNEYLIHQMSEDKNTVLIIDEAQNLSPACLEEVRMLSNLETEKEKLIQIVLVGQPELRRKLEMTRLTQLRQRVAIQFHLMPLSEEDTKKYILHRLNTAKANGREYSNLFEESALGTVFTYSRGVPRMINNICDHALLAGYVADSQVITQAIALEAVETVIKSS
jgi:general secretion pathway protein A